MYFGQLNKLESLTTEGDSPVNENQYKLLVIILEYHRTREILWESGSPTKNELLVIQLAG